MKSFISFISEPFTKYLGYLLLLFTAISFLDIYHVIHQGHYYYAIYLAIDAISISYIIILTYNLISLRSHFAGKIYTILISIFIGIGLLIDAVCIFRFNARFSEDIASIILGTNLNEATEFFNSQLDIRLLVSISLCLGILLLLYLLRNNIHLHNGKYIQYISLALIGILIMLSIHNPAAYKETIIGKYYSFFSIPAPPDLNKYRKHLTLKSSVNHLPNNIVIIIGESFPKSHSSLYNYQKETNPKLGLLKKDSALLVFDQVISPETHTIASFKSIMSTFDTGFDLHSEWYECTTLIEALQALGYQVNWISNQSKVGMHENIVGRFADLCDYQAFCGDKYSGSLRGKVLDEELIPLIKQRLVSIKVNKNICYIIHMMGSHYVFDQRYPTGYGSFTEDQYSDYPKSQRYNRSTLDNSILYNDSIVNEIIHFFANKESLVLYFPDHGLDVYESSDNYCAHGKPENPISRKAGTKIPFMIYLSSTFKQNFKSEAQRMKESIHNPFNTSNLIFSLLDILGVDTLEKQSIKSYSLFFTNSSVINDEEKTN